MKTVRNPEALGSPASYSNGIEVSAKARTLYIAGQVALNKGGVVTPGGIAEQTKAVFANLESVLRSAGMGLDNIVKTTVFLVNTEDYANFASTRSAILKDVKPASTLVYIKQLIRPELLVEIEAVAVAE